MKRKIMYSPGFGAGWVTWCPSELPKDGKQLMITWEPMIVALESGEKLNEYSPSVVSLAEEIERRYGKEIRENLYYGGLDQLRVAEVNGPVHFSEYDGFESFSEVDNTEWL